MTLKSAGLPECLLGATLLPSLTSSRPGDMVMMAMSFLEQANEQCSKISIPMHNCIESECPSRNSHPGLSGSRSRVLPPSPYVLSLNRSAGSMEVSAVFSVTFLRFVSHSCSFTKGQLRLPVTCFL